MPRRESKAVRHARGHRARRAPPKPFRTRAKSAIGILAAAGRALPGRKAPKGRIDPRWRAMFAVREVMLSEPELVWPFILRWGRHRTWDLRAAVGCVLLEHLVECHGDEFFPRVRAEARENRRFASTVMLCADFGPLRQRRRLARLKSDIRRWHGGSRP